MNQNRKKCMDIKKPMNISNKKVVILNKYYKINIKLVMIFYKTNVNFTKILLDYCWVLWLRSNYIVIHIIYLDYSLGN